MTRKQIYYRILTVLMFWAPVVFHFGWAFVFKHVVFITLAVIWLGVCFWVATWIGERTFDRGP